MYETGLFIFINLKYYVSCSDGKISFRINLFYLFFTVVPSNTCAFLLFRPFFVNTTFSTSLQVSSVSWLGQFAVNRTSRPVENVVLTSKGLQERNTQVLDGTTMKNR